MKVVANVPMAGTKGAAGVRMPVSTMAAMRTAAMPSAMKSMPGEVVVTWITAAEMSPMTSAWGMVGRTIRMVRQKAEMMNSGEMAPAETAEIALPTVKLRMKPAASSTASRVRLLMSRPVCSRAAVARARPVAWEVVFWDMMCSFAVACVRGGVHDAKGPKRGPRSNRRPQLPYLCGIYVRGLTVDRPKTRHATTSC